MMYYSFNLKWIKCNLKISKQQTLKYREDTDGYQRGGAWGDIDDGD